MDKGFQQMEIFLVKKHNLYRTQSLLNFTLHIRASISIQWIELNSKVSKDDICKITQH